MKNEIIFYLSNELPAHLEVRFENETIWLTQKQMSILFGKDTDTISLHLKNIFSEKELEENSTTEHFSVVQKEGNRYVSRRMTYYNLQSLVHLGNKRHTLPFNLHQINTRLHFREVDFGGGIERLSHDELARNTVNRDFALR